MLSRGRASTWPCARGSQLILVVGVLLALASPRSAVAGMPAESARLAEVEGADAPSPAESPRADQADSATSTLEPGENAHSAPASDALPNDSAADSSETASEEEGDSTAAGSPRGEAPDRKIREAIRVFHRETEKRGVRADSPRSSTANSGFRNLWHGRLYEYLRNDALDAVPHEVVQHGGDRNILRRNQFGFSVSGPVQIPKLYDGRRSTFFTFSYEGTRERVGRSFLQTLPTAQQRSGDFSDLLNKAGDPVTVYDPASTRANPLFDPSRPVSLSNLEFVRDPFPNNQIPALRLDPVAANTLPHYPLPNARVGPFLQNNYWVNPGELNTPDGFLAKLDHNLFDRHKITVDVADSKGFQAQPMVYPTSANPAGPDRRFSDRSLSITETFSASPGVVYTASVRAATQAVETAGLDSQQDHPAELGLQGVSGTVFPTFRLNDYYGIGPSDGSFFSNCLTVYGTEHSLSLRRGKHFWTLSTELELHQLNTLELESPSGSFQFNDEQTGLPGITNTGNSFASFLLGRSYWAQATDVLQPSYLRSKSWETQVKDEYEVTPNLTATLRLNVDLSTPRVEKFDRQSTIDPSVINPANNMPGALVFADLDGRGRSFQPVRVRLEPGVGLAWSPNSARDTVIRASFMQFYTSVPLRPGTFATQGFSARRTTVSANQQLAPAALLADGLPPLANPLPHLSPTAANDTDADLIAQTSRQPRYRYAALDFERQLPERLTVRLGGRLYRGNDLLVGGHVAALNQIPVDALAYRDQLNNEVFRRSLRPFPQFQEIHTNGQYPDGLFRYESAYVQLEKQASEGLTLDLSYSVRKVRDDYSGPGVQDAYNRANEWSLTRGVRPQQLSLSYIFELPFGPGRPLLSKPGWASRILADWSVSGFTSWSSGDPIVLQPEFNNTGGVVPYLRVNAVPGVDPRVQNPGPGLWFNPAAFVDPEDFSLGNVARTHPNLRNPGMHNHDLSITKRLPITAEQSVEILFQGFNFINHGNWADPDTIIGPPEARNANAGKIIESRGGRVLQVGVRYNF